MDALRPGSGVAPMVRLTPRDQILKAVIRYRRCRHLTSVAYPRTGGREISRSGGSSTWNTEVVQGNGGQINYPFFVPSSNLVRLGLGLFYTNKQLIPTLIVCLLKMHLISFPIP